MTTDAMTTIKPGPGLKIDAPVPDKKPLTHVILVIDRSGSMASIWDAMRKALAEQIDNLRSKKEQKIRVWTVLFDTDTAMPYQASKLKAIDVDALFQRFPPRGSTALFDTLRDTVLQVEDEVHDPDCAFLCITVTDGFENASNHTTGEELRETLERLQKTDRWTFVYLGANQDITKVSAQTGINTNSAMAYAATPDSVSASIGWGSPTMASTDAYFGARSRGATSTPDFFTPEDDKDEQT